MGMIARVLEFVRSVKGGENLAESKCDPGSGALEHGQHFQPAGFDGQPLPQDAAYLDDAGGVMVTTGYADTRTAGESGPGEGQIYGRDPTTGARLCRVWAKDDGTVLISNAFGSFELAPDGTFTINGLTIDPSGNLVTSGEVTASGVALSTHTHGYVDNVGEPPEPTPSVTESPS